MLSIAPIANRLHVVRVVDNRLLPVRDLGVAPTRLWTPWRDTFLVCSQTDRTLWIVSEDLGKEETWRLPEEDRLHEVKDIAVVGDRVFVAGWGRWEGPYLYHRSLVEQGVDWEDGYPHHLGVRKSIDVLLVSGTTLIAVDNVITPKLALTFRDADGGTDQPAVDTLFWGVNARIISAALCYDRLAILSRCASRLSRSTEINFVALSELGRGSTELHLPSLGDLSASEAFWSHDVDDSRHFLAPALMEAKRLAFGADRLVAACGAFGVLVTEPGRISGPHNLNTSDDIIRERAFACVLAVEQLPLHRLVACASRQAKAVEDVTSVGDAGVVAWLRMSDDTLHALLLDKSLLQAIVA